jgi:hypothetical protein
MNFEPTAEPFAPAETSGYGNGPRPHIGFFGSYERLFWSLGKPSVEAVGSNTATGPFFFQSFNLPGVETNTVDTGFLLANGAWGNRWELGYVDTDNYGWMASILDHVSQGQYHVANNVWMQFGDPQNLLNEFIQANTLDLGKGPVRFDVMTFKNITHINGVELMRIYRAAQLHNGGYFELLYGARWLQLEDTFAVSGAMSGSGSGSGTSTTGIVGTFNPLSDSTWSTRIQNNMVGPQIGGRWSNQRGRWILSAEARFLAAANLVNAHQKTNLGTNTLVNTAQFLGTLPTPLGLQGLGTDTRVMTTTFAPVGELRFQVVYQIAANVGLKLGYTGLVMGDISRASNRIDYNSPNIIGILPGNIHQSFVSNGFNIGVEFNR